MLGGEPSDEVRPRAEQHCHLPIAGGTELEASIHD
jgi:hypothetical protein